MKKLLNALMVLCLTVILSVSSAQVPVSLAATSKITTTPTGYDSADDVDYQTYTVSGKQIIANWGARGEDCVFLSTKAQAFYTGSNTYDNLSKLTGGTSQSNVRNSALFKALTDLQATPHTFYTYYDGSKNVRNYYKYTDCVSNDVSKVSRIYIGDLVSSTWDSNVWNQEHMWPKSKLSTSQQIGDIMQLRPSQPNENSRRNNFAYGVGSGCYEPKDSVKGDCARLFLYMYTRWNLSSSVWGAGGNGGGVMQNMDVLLEWMEIDPVDTWEMGRNDAVQSVTGTRNAFVDYPELAWLLFSEDIPNITTPSGKASGSSGSGSGEGGNTHTHSYGTWIVVTPATESAKGLEKRVCSGCGNEETRDIPVLSHTHKYGEWTVVTPATNDAAGLEKRVCSGCGNEETREIPALDSNHNFSAWITITSPTYDNAGLEQRTCKDCGETQTRERPSLSDGHSFSAWIVIKNPTNDTAGLEQRTCKDCGETQTRDIPALGGSSDENSSTVEVAPDGTEKGCNGSLNLPMVGILAIAYSVMLVTRKKHK